MHGSRLHDVRTGRVRALLSALLALGLVVLGGVVAVSASAHVPAVTADCDQLAVSLTAYNTGGINHVTVTVAGDVVDDTDFGKSYHDTFDAPDKYASYHYTVVVTAHDDPTGSEGWTKSFEGDSTACAVPEKGHTPVNVCHATSSDTNPYVFITVDDDSVKLKGHLQHRDNPNKTWKSDGVWRGTTVHAGDAKRDLIGDYTDAAGKVHTYDGSIKSKADCGTLTPPVVVVPQPSGDLNVPCLPSQGALAVTADVDSDGAKNAQYRLHVVTGDSASDIATTESALEAPAGVTVPGAAVGSTIALQVRLGDAGSFVTLDGPVTVVACEEQPPPPKCADTITTADVSAHYVTDNFHAAVAYTGSLPLCEGVTKVVSLNSYQTGGPTWPTSGTQVFVDHDVVTIDRTHTSGTLVVDQPSCYYQTDLYWGGTRYDGVDGPVPHYDDVRIAGLIDHRNGGKGCTPPVNASGSFTVVCDEDGAVVTVGTLSHEAGVTWTLRVNGASQAVSSGAVVQVPAESSLALVWKLGGTSHVEQTATAPKACPAPVVTPPAGGPLVTHCTATGASVDVGTLSQGSATGGSFALAVNGTTQPVTSGQTGIAVPAGASLVLRYVPASGPAVDLASATAPAACPAVVPPTTVVPPATVVPPTTGLSVVKSVFPTGPAAFGDTLTYGLAVTSSGNSAQTGVTVTDAVPAGTTYQTGTATCDGGCSSVTATNGVITWVIGDMAAGTTRTVHFAVTIDKPEADADGGLPAVTIVNTGSVSSTQVPAVQSNEVETPIVAVEGVKNGPKPPATEGTQLPHTGAGSLGAITTAALLLVALGGGLLLLGSARPTAGRRRRTALGG